MWRDGQAQVRAGVTYESSSANNDNESQTDNHHDAADEHTSTLLIVLLSSKNTTWYDIRISWTEKKTNECVLNNAGVKRELLDTVKARKLAYYGQTMRKQGSCLEKEIMQGTMPGACRQGRPRAAWMDNIKMWTGLPAESSAWSQKTEK